LSLAWRALSNPEYAPPTTEGIKTAPSAFAAGRGEAIRGNYLQGLEADA